MQLSVRKGKKETKGRYCHTIKLQRVTGIIEKEILRSMVKPPQPEDLEENLKAISWCTPPLLTLTSDL